MRIALDARYRTGSGASVYVHSLLSSLCANNDRYEFVVVKSASQNLPQLSDLEAVISPDFGAAKQVAWDQTVLPRVLRKRRIDLYHPLKMLGSLSAPCPQIKVAHSITCSYRGEFPTAKTHNLYWIALGNHLFRRSTRLIAVSNFVREFLIEAVGVPESRIAVIYNGIGPEFRPSDGESDARALLGVDKPFVLSVGNVVPVKNHLAAVLAFAKIAGRFPDHQLVVAGATAHPYFRAVTGAVERAGLAHRVHFPGHVESKRLAGLYRQADMLLMPSLTEGCPLSVLEAMACGLPVVGSGRGGIPEIGGDAIRVIEAPGDIGAWADAAAELLEKPQIRARMREASIRRAARFSWDETARQTMELYDEVLTTGVEPKRRLRR